MKTIVVDDEVLLLDQFAYESSDISELEILGYFDSSTEALAFAKEHPVDVVFLDIKMPEMDGFTLAKELEKLYPHIKLIAVTSSENSTNKVLAGSMHGVLAKPFSQEDLRRILKKIED